MRKSAPRKSPAELSRWLTTKQAAEYLGVTDRWVKRAKDEGRLPYSKRNRLVLYERADLDAIIEAQRVPAFNPNAVGYDPKTTASR